MKKLLLIIIAVMAFTGLSLAQDVWSLGHRTNSTYNNRETVLYHNSNVYTSTYMQSSNFDMYPADVMRFNGDTYWSYNVRRTVNPTGFLYGKVLKGTSTYLDLGTADETYITSLCNDGTNVYTVGYKVINGVTHAVVWKNNNATPFYILDNSSAPSNARGCVCYNGDLYVCGSVGSGTSSQGKIWKNGSVFVSADYYQSSFYEIIAGNGNLYFICRDSRNSTDTYRVYTISNPNVGSFTEFSVAPTDVIYEGISADEGHVYMYANVLNSSNRQVKIFKDNNDNVAFNSSTIYNTSYSLPERKIKVTTKGVYWFYTLPDGSCIKKDNTVLYGVSTFNYAYLDAIDIEDECEDNSTRNLPYYEDFEENITDWRCWTTIDEDNNNLSSTSFWFRKEYSSGAYYASHNYGPVGYPQVGWLISPRLHLQSGQSSTTLTFSSYEGYPLSYGYEGVWISTTNTNPSSFTQVWTQSNPAGSWNTIVIDLGNYQGQDIYIAFKYTGNDAHDWYIDNISVTETAPTQYTITANASPTSGGTVTGGGQYNAGATCTLQATPASGYEFLYWKKGNTQVSTNPNYSFTVTENATYTAYFQQSAPTQYTITVNANNNAWGTVSGGGQYNAGATCTLTATPASGYEFLYWKKGNTQVSTNATYSFTVTENATYTAYFQQSAPTQYTITVNANNNAWGTVSGGGQYNAGATCTLHATPASGYQFDSWKKNGSVVSTNPNYSFTVTENATYTAYFSAEPVTYYTITTNVTPTGAGTVTGGGTFPAGSSITLTATANPGYTFSQWQDGSTANPRTITVNGDATYTAQFTQDIYTISVYANPANGGTVTGGGAYHYGETPTLTATANSGYEFQGWNDGVSTNPRQITVTGNATYTAIFSEVGATYYVVTTSVSPAGAGTVTGGGAYEAGTVITLAATANPGYTFSQWNDGITQNPRTVTVNSNLSFTAIFTQNIYTITVLANPSNAGTVTGGGAYHYGEIVTLTATAYSGYEFQGWSDGSSQNPHQVTVTGNATYTATFSQSGTTYYTVSTYVSPIGAGTVTGAGTYPAGATATLSATANQGYTFSRWNDGSTSNPRTVTVNNNMSFTAIFTAQQYTITVNANPSNGGTVTGGGTYAYGSTATLRAMPNSGFEFMQWQDGSTQNPRVITVTGNATYTALFNTQGGTVYTLTVTPNYPLLGQTFGSGTYPAGSTVEIAAYPSEYAVFVQWNDGNTQNPRTVVVNSNVEYIAEFRAANRYTITVESANPNMGEAYGGGTFFEGAVTEISAIPNAGYVFTGWNDGNTQNPRTITVTGDATYTANFSENSVITHTLTVICNTDQGTVSGGGIYMHGATAVIQAFPNQGYVFTKWSDENTENPRMVTMTNDLTLVAFFATGVGENEEPVLMVYPNPTKESIRILGIEANSSVQIYNSLGELVRVVSASEDQEINVRDLASGLYLLRCGNATLRFIKEQ